MHLVIDNPIMIRVHVMVKGLTIIQHKFDMEKTLGLGVELGQCSTSQVCPLLFVPRHVMAYYSLYSYAKNDLINIKEGNLFKQEDIIIIKEGSLFVLFWDVGFFVFLSAPRCFHNV